MSSVAKKGVGLYFDIVAIVLAVIGIIAMVVSSTMGVGYEFAGLPIYLVASIAAIALVAVAIVTDTKAVDKGPGIIAMIALAVAILLLVYSGVQVVASRALTISGLFSWNSMDATGWKMFYAAVVSAAGLVGSAVVLMIGCFLPIAKKA